MATQDQLADFIRRRISIGRVQPGTDSSYAAWYAMTYHAPSLPAVGQVAAELVRDTEFRALQLGTFLNTPTGEFLEQAAVLAVPKSVQPGIRPPRRRAQAGGQPPAGRGSWQRDPGSDRSSGNRRARQRGTEGCVARGWRSMNSILAVERDTATPRAVARFRTGSGPWRIRRARSATASTSGLP